jgi:glutamine amidotransferase
LLTWADHGGRFLAAVENGPLSATQFHPEKSGEPGIRLLRNWLASL